MTVAPDLIGVGGLAGVNVDARLEALTRGFCNAAQMPQAPHCHYSRSSAIATVNRAALPKVATRPTG